jgi:hypothetical protein
MSYGNYGRSPNRRVTKSQNPRNSDSPLYKRLTRIFSGPIVNRKQQTVINQKRRHLDKHKFTSASGLSFKKAEYNPFERVQANALLNQNRTERYIDFDQMEFTPEIHSALDIYADEMTTCTSLEEMMDIQCSNEEIKVVLRNLYKERLNVDYNLFGWCRAMCKNGDMFLYLDIDENEGIKSVLALPPGEIERMEGEDETNANYVQFQWNSGGMTLENWQIAHFRILGNDKYAPYGTSVLEPARRIWRQLTLLEDAMMAYRIVRAPDRRVFYIDVGHIAPQDVEGYIQKTITQMKRNQVVDDRNGRVDLRYNPTSIEEDFFIPTRGGVSSKIESLPGGSYTGDIDDVKYLRDKLFSALKVPQSYLSRGEGSDEDKTTLAQKDIRFARTVQRLQRVVITELEKVGIIHLYTLGYRGDDLTSFKLLLNNPSKIAELQELEQWRTKFDVASSATDGYFSRRWVAKKLFNMTDEDFLRNERERYYDHKYENMMQNIDADEGEGGLGGVLGDFSDEELEDLAGSDDIDALEGGDDLGDEAGGEEGETGALLAAPARREDRHATTTPRSKGKWYTPVKHRGGDRRGRGARHRHFKSQWADEMSGRSERAVMGSGAQGLASLARGVTEQYQQWEDDYRRELFTETKEEVQHSTYESKMLNNSLEIKKLINELKTSKVKQKEEVLR